MFKKVWSKSWKLIKDTILFFLVCIKLIGLVLDLSVQKLRVLLNY